MQRFLLIAVTAMALASGARAVTIGDGPGGVGTTDGNSQLELWVKADTLSLADGATVAMWNDASGNGRNLTQGSASLRPVFVSSALGGKPVVRFTADDFSSLALPSTSNEFTIVTVIKPVTTGAYHNVFEGQGGVRPMLWIDGIGNYEFNFNTGAVTPATGNYDVLFGVKRNAGPQYSQLYLNGPIVTVSGANAFNIAASQTYTCFNRSGNQAFNGDIAELIIYSTALTQTEINKVGYYLQQKYSLPTNFPSPFPILTGYQTNPAIYGVNVAIAPNAPVLTGGVAATSFAISPTLPDGLIFNPSSGVISGTPTTVAVQANYTVTATFSGQPDSSTQLSLAVTTPALIGYSRNPAIFTRTRVANAVTPLLRSGPATGFSISPALPAGLSLDPQTGVISGTPNVSVPSATYTVTATFAGYPASTYVLTLEVLEPSYTLDITEFMATNDNTLADGDGAFSDWIEIQNYGAVPLDLDGWSLTDNAGILRKWVFPTRILVPGAYLVVFASGDAHTDAADNLHTNFKLEGDGEYLALVQPDGVTIARQFAPTFPAQSAGVSYGTRDRVTYGSYAQPTPGAENGFFSAVSTFVTDSPSGRAFTSTLNVTLSAPLGEGAVIRYTLNGAPPTAASAVYSGPLSFSANARLRARIFQPGLNPGPECSEVYLRLGADLQGFSSNLPLIFLSSDGAIAAASSTTLTGTSAVVVGVDGLTGRSSATDIPNYAGRSGLRIRGRSSQSFPQKQFKFETWDGAGNESKAPLLGLASSSNWVLNSPWSEKSLVRNALAYRTWEKLGRPSLGTRFVEVFINDDGDGQFTYADDYAGIYLLVEPPKLDAIGISGPQNTTTYANITGGYLTETGVGSEDQSFTTSASGRVVGFKDSDPGTSDLNTTQRAWIRDYIANFEMSLYGSGFIHPTNGRHYSTYTDVNSQVDYKIVREWSRNFDGGSTYFYVPRADKLTMGPLWDYNWAFGNVNYAEGGDLPGYRTDGWNRSFTGISPWAPWWLRFEQDPDWWQLFIDRWAELRATVLSDAAVNAQIDEMTAPLAQEAAARNFARWPQLGVFTSISPPGYETRTTYQSEVDYLKNWVRDRSAWIDSQFPQRPSFSRSPGQVAAGTPVTISAAAGQTIYYTKDGSDPRSAGGSVSSAALSVTSGGTVAVNASVMLKARVKNGTVWGAPASGAFVTGTAASSQNLVISEFSYHPANPTPTELSVNPALIDDDFEFIELHNVSGTTLDLAGVAFTEGVQFMFPVGMTLAPNAYAVVVKNASAFPVRYGGNAAVVGQYAEKLDNSGETIGLMGADGAFIVRFHYSEAWTPAADGGGYSLTLQNPDNALASYGSPSVWALSGTVNGSPGAPNGLVVTSDFTLWQQSIFSDADLAYPQRSGPLADPDGDSAPNLLEFASGTLPLDATSHPVIDAVVENNTVTLVFTRRRQALDIIYTVEESTDLVTWTPVNAPFEIISQTASTETVHILTPQNIVSKKFLRLKVTKAN